jgi:glutamine synthetase
MADAAAAVAGAGASLPPGSYPLSTTANSFLAGVLDHVPALLPFTAPSVNSFERFKPSCWSGAEQLLYRHTRMKRSACARHL